jgi:tetratricopeptide (TPR) repeat protein
LDSWKAIAAHLGRSPRTVQRWHARLGLPVNHLAGKKSSVFAYPEELDSWFASRGALSEAEPKETARSELFHTLPTFGLPIPRQEERAHTLISEPARKRSAELTASANRMWEILSARNLTTISSYFREAIDLDHRNAPAFAGLSFVLIVQGLYGIVSTSIAYVAAKAALDRALEIDSDLRATRCAAAWIKMISQRDWQGASVDFEEALSRQAADCCVLMGRAVLHIAEERLEKASQLLLDAEEKAPLSSFSAALYCWNEYLRNKFEKSLYRINQVRATGRSGPVMNAVEALAYLQLEERDACIDRLTVLAAASPHNQVVQGTLGCAFAREGMLQQAGKLLKSMTEAESRGKGCEPYAVALILIGMNEKHNAVERLQESYREGSLWSLGFRSDPVLAPLRREPTFREFLKKAGYPETQNSRALEGR